MQNCDSFRCTAKWFITGSMDMNLGKLQEMVWVRKAWHAAALGVAKSLTWLGDWAATKVIHVCIYIYMFLFRFCSIIGCCKILHTVPWALQQISVVPSHVQYLCVNSSFIPFGNKFVSWCLWVSLFCKFICIIFFDSTYKWYDMIFVFLCLTSLSMMISRSIHVATNGIISFFLWESNIPSYIHHTFIHSSVSAH